MITPLEMELITDLAGIQDAHYSTCLKGERSSHSVMRTAALIRGGYTYQYSSIVVKTFPDESKEILPKERYNLLKIKLLENSAIREALRSTHHSVKGIGGHRYSWKGVGGASKELVPKEYLKDLRHLRASIAPSANDSAIYRVNMLFCLFYPSRSLKLIASEDRELLIKYRNFWKPRASDALVRIAIERRKLRFKGQSWIS